MRRILMTSLVVAGAMSLLGCQSGSSNSGSSAGAKTAAAVVPVTVSPSRNALLIRRGVAPISYLAGAGGRLYVRDVAAQKWILETDVENGSLITVDAKKGVVIGQRVAKKGPLPTTQLELWLDTVRKD